MKMSVVRYGSTRNCIAHDLPRFETRAHLEADTKWLRYFKGVYGDIPSSGFPICIADFLGLYTHLLTEIGVKLLRSTRMNCPKKLSDKAPIYWYPAREPPWLSMLLHPHKEPIPSNSWVEITHRSMTSETESMWFRVNSGTGIWFNTGQTISFRNYDEARRYFKSGKGTKLKKLALHHGYDSMQFIDCDGVSNDCCRQHHLGPRCFNIEIMALNLRGSLACGGKSNVFRTGWNASKPCDCDEHSARGTNSLGKYVNYANCKGYASHNYAFV